MQFKSLTNHLCRSEEEKITAYNIRYQAYTTVGYNPVCTRGLFTDIYDEKPNNFSFLLKDKGKPVATVRVSILHRPFGWLDLPCKGGFEPELAKLEQEFDTIIEVGRLAVQPEISRVGSVAPLALFSNIFMVDERFGRTLIVCASGKKHKRFYERLGMKSLCGFAPRPNTAIELTLMAKELDIEDFIARGYIDEQTIRRLVPEFPDA